MSSGLKIWQVVRRGLLKEGLCDHIAFGGNVDVGELAAALRAGDATLDLEKSGQYELYRLLVAYFLDWRNWTINQLLASKLSLLDVKTQLLMSQ